MTIHYWYLDANARHLPKGTLFFLQLSSIGKDEVATAIQTLPVIDGHRLVLCSIVNTGVNHNPLIRFYVGDKTYTCSADTVELFGSYAGLATGGNFIREGIRMQARDALLAVWDATKTDY